MKNFIRLLLPLALLQVVACTESVGEPTGSGGSGGSGGNMPNDTTSTGGGGAPVECKLGEGAPAGSACSDEGEICDFAGSGCWVACTDGVWVEECVKCPEELPQDGSDCKDYYGVGSCSYESNCGDMTTATCDDATGVWTIDAVDCG